MKCDLHIHSIASDGQYSQKQIIDMAYKSDITMISISDHDTLDAIEGGIIYAEEIGIDFIPGIEISTQDEVADEEIHILGYGIDPCNADLIKACDTWKQARSNRGKVIKDFLETKGLSIDLNVVRKYAGEGNLGRPHFARYLMDTGVVSSRKEAFERYLDTADFRAATDRIKPSPMTAIELIHGAGGKAVLAHPGIYRMRTDTVDDLTKRLVKKGLDGIECFYSRHTQEQTEHYLSLIEQYGLLTSCGSDFHGEIVKPDIELGMDFDFAYYGRILITEYL